ncbi:glycoside hydrolase family protein [Paenibacillus alba]|uniref:Glycoside hydrolase family protein n=1 Tax=Paenibacillus alba TaxID=1197127 RepID=A0ABU6FVR9_9BACL|nr:glycoside hydrolase family protein [Paenibacillus alba]MEC0225993.1 glycoside hydrolase family protein [Paenibacillus alba]
MKRFDEQGFDTWISEATADNVFAMEDYHVSCGSITRAPDGQYCLVFSRWPEWAGFEGWLTHAEIAAAVSDHPAGPYTFDRVLLERGEPGWDCDVTHNPAVLEVEGTYYLYYVGTQGPEISEAASDEAIVGEKRRVYRNNQRIGIAMADHPLGPWQRFDEPILDVTPGAWDAVMTSSPAICRAQGRNILMLYTGAAEGGAVKAGIARAERPIGPFAKIGMLDIDGLDNGLAVEDACIWFQDERFYALMKDDHGYVTKSEPGAFALLESEDGLSWQAADQPLALRKELAWTARGIQSVTCLARPQIYLEEGKPLVLSCTVVEAEGTRAYTMQIPLRT